MIESYHPCFDSYTLSISSKKVIFSIYIVLQHLSFFMSKKSYTIVPLGDSALTINFGNVIDVSINKEVISLYHLIKAAPWFGVKDVVPAYSTLTIHYDVVAVLKSYSCVSAFDAMKNKLDGLLLQKRSAAKPSRSIKIPVCYTEKYALDLQEITMLTNLSFAEIVQIHISRKYRVYMVGFLPGFAYMGEVDERIAVPRKQEPRVKIEEGFVGIAGKQTGIYPLTSPGGWQIIGRTPLKLFDKEKEDPVLFKAGDEVAFFSITEDEFENY